jgi:hypothetical protein
MRISAFVALMLMTAAGLAPRPAAAAFDYPSCATYYDVSRGIKSCAFTSYEQCMATISGVGGVCSQNPFYPPQPPPSAERLKAKKSHVAGDR